VRVRLSLQIDIFFPFYEYNALIARCTLPETHRLDFKSRTREYPKQFFYIALFDGTITIAIKTPLFQPM